MTWIPRHDDPLFMLAMDHRDSFGRTLFGVRDDRPDPDQLAAMRAAKRLIFDGLREAAAHLPYGHPGVLVDEQYGGDVITEVRRDRGRITLAVPLEASGREWFGLEWGDDWRDHVEELRPDYAKVLVRDNPAFDPAAREQQLDLLAEVARGLDEIGIPLLYELLVPGTAEQVGDDPYRYDRDLRPALVVRAIADNQAHGIEPRIWKVEGLETVAAAEQVADQARRGGADLIVLGRDAPVDRLNHWLEVAAAVPAFVGFAIGRSIWADAIRDWRRDHDDAAARRTVAARYSAFAQQWRP